MEKMKKKRETEEFIMSPTVDICFKELMQNPKVRKGIVAAILGKDPDEIESTVLMPTILQQEYADRCRNAECIFCLLAESGAVLSWENVYEPTERRRRV